MNAKLEAEERARVEAEEVCGEKLLEIDELKCVRLPSLLLRHTPHPPHRCDNDALAAAAADKELEAEAATEAATALAAEAQHATSALATVSSSILRWRDQLVLTSLQPDSYGSEATAQQVLAVVADMDNEVEVNVMMADALPAELRAQLQAKQAELARRKRAEAKAKVCEGWTFQPRLVTDVPARLARLVTHAAAKAAQQAVPAAVDADAEPPSSSSNCSHGVVIEELPAETQPCTPGRPPRAASLDKENAAAAVAGRGQGSSGACAPFAARPLTDMLSNAVHLAQQAAKPSLRGARRSPVKPKRASPLAAAPPSAQQQQQAAALLLQLPTPRQPFTDDVPPPPPSQAEAAPRGGPGDLTLPGELPGGPTAVLLYRLPSLKLKPAKGGKKLARQGSDRRTALAAAVAAFESDADGAAQRIAAVR